jgi:hypothetical protein
MSFGTYQPEIGEVRTQRLSDGCMYDFTWDGLNWQPGAPYDCIDLSGGGFGGTTDSARFTHDPPKFICQGEPGATFEGWTLNSITNVVEQFAPGTEICLSTYPPRVQRVISGPVWNSSVSPSGIYEAVLSTASYTQVAPPTTTPPAPASGTGYIQTQFDTNASINLDTLISAAVTRTSDYILSTPQRGTVSKVGSVVTYDPVGNYSGADAFSFTYNVSVSANGNVNSYTLVGIVYVNILPPTAPTVTPTATITASPGTISLGRSSVLSWNAGNNATVAFIQPGIGSVGINGSVAVSPLTTTTYTLTAQNNLGVQTTATVAVTVIPVAAAPVAVNIGVNCAYQQSAVIPLIYTGEVTSAAITAAPLNGTAFLQGYTVNYTAGSGFVGVDTLTYSVTGPGGTDTAIITITVQSPGCPQPSISLAVAGVQTAAYNTATTITFNLSGTVDKVFTASNPTYGTVSAATIGTSTATVSYTPNSSFLGGSDSFVVVAEGPCGQTSGLTVQLQVSPPPPPVPLGSTISVNHNTPRTFFFTYSGFASGVLILSQPANGVLTATTTPFQYTYTPRTDYNGSDSIIFRVTGPGGVSVDAAEVVVSVAAAPVIVRPEPVSFFDLLNQPSNITVFNNSVTFVGGFLPNYTVSLWCESDSYTTGANGHQLTNLYAVGFRRNRAGNVAILGNTGVPVENSDIFEPIVKTAVAVAGTTRTLRFRVRVSGNVQDPSFSRDTFFDVITAPADQQPNVFDLVNQSNLEINATVTTNTVLISGMTPGIPTPASVTGARNPVIIVNDGFTETVAGNTTTVYDGYTIKIRTTTPSTYSTTANYTVTVGAAGTPVSDTFSISTRNPFVSDPPWNFGNRGNLELNTRYQTLNTVTFAQLETTANISVNNGGNIVLNGADTLSSSATISNISAVAINGVTANAYNSTRTFTVTLAAGPVTKTDTFTLGTRVKDVVPTITGDFANLTYQQLNTSVSSGNVSVTDFDETLTLTLTSTDTTANLVVNGVTSGNSAVISSGANVSITGNSAADYYTLRSYQITAGGVSKIWTVQTKPNDDLNLLNIF